MIPIVFYTFAFLSVLGGLLILFNRHLMHNVLALLLSLLSIAGVYVLAGADFLGVAQVMVYVGGVLVLLLFGVMFVSGKSTARMHARNGRIMQGGAIAAGMMAVLGYAIHSSTLPAQMDGIVEDTTSKLGVTLMTTHLLPFEAAAVLLLAALAGALQIAAEKKDSEA